MRVLVVVPLAALGAVLAAIFPLTPAFSPAETGAATIAAVVTAAASVAWVPLADRFAQRLPRAGADDVLTFVAALGSAGAATIHLAVAKMHFDEYPLFGLFFVGSGIAQLVWPLWLLFPLLTPRTGCNTATFPRRMAISRVQHARGMLHFGNRRFT